MAAPFAVAVKHLVQLATMRLPQPPAAAKTFPPDPLPRFRPRAFSGNTALAQLQTPGARWR